jgi:hypothetical protein
MPILPLGDDRFRFEPHTEYRGPVVPPSWETEDYANETMLFSADVGFARKNGGPMTQYALAALEKHYRISEEATKAPDLYGVIDTRVHMLMPGMIPAIGGWHCDGVPRPGGDYADQPNPRMFDHRVAHYTITTSQSETSKTAFLAEPLDVYLPPGARVWTALHKAIAEKPRKVVQADHGWVARFDLGTPHKASVTTTAGWRFFFRYSLYNSVPRNQIRRQVQVYIPHEGHGW